MPEAELLDDNVIRLKRIIISIPTIQGNSIGIIILYSVLSEMLMMAMSFFLIKSKQSE